MRALQSQETLDYSGMTPEDFDQRLAREIRAREEAEQLLESKAHDLALANNVLKKIAAALESQRAQLNTIFDHARAGILLTGKDMVIGKANPVAVKLFDLGPHYYMAHQMTELIDGPPSAFEWIDQRLQLGFEDSSAMIEVTGRKLSGELFPMELSLSIIQQNDSGQAVWVIQDISERKAEEARRAELERELSQAQRLEALGTLASGIAHEINTPIQYIGDNTRFLRDSFNGMVKVLEAYRATLAGERSGGADRIAETIKAVDLTFLLAETPQALEQSLQGLDQVAHIVNAIKEFSHPGAAAKRRVDLNAAIQTALTVSRNHWKHIANVQTELDPDLPEVLCRAGDINQVLLNLIINAADAIADTKPVGFGLITLGSRRTADSGGVPQVEIWISDTGCGMTEDVRNHIFDPFFTTKEVGKGTGQGLSICYDIIRTKHGGSITCASAPGQGATFTLRLPLIPPDDGTGAEPVTDEYTQLI